MHVLQEVSVVCLAVCVVVSCTQPSQETDQDNSNTTPASRHRRNVNDGNPFMDLMNALQSDGMTNTEMYVYYTPSTPAPHDINCYVEVPTTVRRGGQCVQLGATMGGVGMGGPRMMMGGSRRGRMGAEEREEQRRRIRPWACQSGIHLEVSSHCQELMEAHQSGRRGRGHRHMG